MVRDPQTAGKRRSGASQNVGLADARRTSENGGPIFPNGQPRMLWIRKSAATCAG